MKQEIVQLKEEVSSAKIRVDELSKEIKRIEKDMGEFDANKDGKLAELQKTIEKQRKAVDKASSTLKPILQDLREAKSDVEQSDAELSTARESREENVRLIAAQEDELKTLKKQQKTSKVWISYD